MLWYEWKVSAGSPANYEFVKAKQNLELRKREIAHNWMKKDGKSMKTKAKE